MAHDRDGFGNIVSGPDRLDGNDRAYENRFDPRRELTYTSRFLEVPDQQRMQNIKDEQRERQGGDYDDDAGQGVEKFWPSVGKFIIPTDDNGDVANSWAAHAALVKDSRNELAFDPEKYVFFDKIIAEKLGLPALYDATDADYAKYEGLRTNLEVLRNDIIGIYLHDGSFDPGDEIYVPCIEGIAAALGDALANDTWYKRPFTRSFSVDVANVEGVGAAEMYSYLLSIQHEQGALSTLRSNINSLIGLADREWGLPEVSETPFSPENLAAPLHAALAAVQPAPARPEVDNTARMAALSEQLGGNVKKLRSVDEMQEPPRAESVEEARKILRYLRNLSGTDKDMEEWLDMGTPGEQVAKTEAMEQLTHIFTARIKQAQAQNPEFLREDAPIEDASNAAAAMARAVAEHTLSLLPRDHPQVPRLETLLADLPEASDMLQLQSVERLLNALETGLERATGQQAGDMTPLEKLLAMSKRIEATAQQLRSVDTLEEPAREESIELAREILRKLRNLSFADQPMLEMIDTGRPEDKAALAEKIVEMVDNYQNLLREAAQINPAILSDPLIKDASDAVDGFAAAVSHMAAKEMPLSKSAADSITAAESAKSVEQLEGQSIKKLVGRIGDALEKTVGAISADQEAQQDEDLAQDNVENALQNADQSRRKRKKRRSGGKTGGLTRAAKRRNAGDLNGDGIADKLQGITMVEDGKSIRVDAVSTRAAAKQNKQDAFMGLKPEDMAAIKKLGGSLRDIGQQLSGLSAATNITASDAVAPDDKGFALRNTERDQQNQKSGQSGPRVG